MPYQSGKGVHDHSMDLLINVVQYAHLLREIRRTSSMGIVFHLANYRHWKDMSAERLAVIAAPDSRELVSQAVSSASCKVLLQILQTANNDMAAGYSSLCMTADAEFGAFINLLRQRSELQDCMLTAFNGIDVFSIGIYLVDRSVSGNEAVGLRPNSSIRPCLEILTTISEHFVGIRSLRDVLSLFSDLVSDCGPNTEVDMFRLDQECQKPGSTISSKHRLHMRTILMRNAQKRLSADNWRQSRRETLPNI